MSVFKDILFWKNEDWYYGNQHTAALMLFNNTEESVLVYDPLHLDYIFALTN